MATGSRSGRGTAWEGRGRRLTLLGVAFVAVGTLGPIVWFTLMMSSSYVPLWTDAWFLFACGAPIVVPSVLFLVVLWLGVRRVARSLPGKPPPLHEAAGGGEVLSPSVDRGRRGQS